MAPLDLGHALVVVLVARLQLGAAPALGGVQLRDPALLLLDDVALPPLLGRRQLLLVAPAHAQDLVAVIALLGLGQRLVSLAFRGQLQPLLFLAAVTWFISSYYVDALKACETVIKDKGPETSCKPIPVTALAESIS